MLIKKWKSKKKSLLLLVLKSLNVFIKLIPATIILNFDKIKCLSRAYRHHPNKDIILNFTPRGNAEKKININALAYREDVHSKHKLMPYYQSLIDNIFDGEKVIDTTYGYATASWSIPVTKPNSKVLRIDNDKTRLQQALESKNSSNLQFIDGDAIDYPFKENWDVVLLSNVLEHIEFRAEFLMLLNSNIKANRFLIGVPYYERDWQVPLRDIFGVNYFTDSDHKIEHTVSEFSSEINKAKLEISEIFTNWGEIWSVCIPVNK
jgi:2-polyprenyl-3-methyl-5-hydroxy-6-metoxy-1,4-benzoquinol methylase